MLSGYSDFEYARQAMRSGVMEYLVKPVDDEELSQAILRARKRIESQKTADNLTKKLSEENESMINNAENNNEDNYNMDESLNELKIFGEEDEENNDNILEKEIENKNEENETKDVNNLKIEELNREIALFQDKRTELMDQKTYEEYIKCRQINFLSRGKKFFLNYMQNILNEEDKFPNEFKELTNIEFIAFILNEEIKKIIINSIKEKNPAKKLFILTQPLSPEDIDYYIQKEISILSDFLDKFHNDIIMINEFRKKKINNRVYNKFTKVKNGKNGEVFLVIKKLSMG